MGKIYGICLQCKQPYHGQGRKFCSNKCKGEYAKGKPLNISDEHRKFLSESMREKTKGKHHTQEHNDNIGKASKLRWEDKTFHENMCKQRQGHEVKKETREKIRIGNLGIKKPGVSEYNRTRPKVRGWHHTKESKKIISEKVSGEKNGQFGKPPPNITPFPFIDKIGRKFILRSSWEEKLAKYFDQNNIKWDYEKITYKLSNGETYTPDFFTDGCVYEVKGYFYEKSKEKFESFLKEYSDIKIILANREFLENLLNTKL